MWETRWWKTQSNEKSSNVQDKIKRKTIIQWKRKVHKRRMRQSVKCHWLPRPCRKQPTTRVSGWMSKESNIHGFTRRERQWVRSMPSWWDWTPTRTDFLQIFTRYLVKPRSETSLWWRMREVCRSTGMRGTNMWTVIIRKTSSAERTTRNCRLPIRHSTRASTIGKYECCSTSTKPCCHWKIKKNMKMWWRRMSVRMKTRHCVAK